MAPSVLKSVLKLFLGIFFFVVHHLFSYYCHLICNAQDVMVIKSVYSNYCFYSSQVNWCLLPLTCNLNCKERRVSILQHFLKFTWTLNTVIYNTKKKKIKACKNLCIKKNKIKESKHWSILFFLKFRNMTFSTWISFNDWGVKHVFNLLFCLYL